MGWETTFQDASFKGAPFLVNDTSDPESRALGIHEYPYKPGADVEDLGLKAQRIHVTAFLNGPTYEQQLAALLTALRSPGPGRLVHPIYGAFETVYAETWTPTHKDGKRNYCELQLSFVVSSTETPVFNAKTASGSVDSIGTSSLSAQLAAGTSLLDRISSIQSSAMHRLDALSAAMMNGQSMLAQLMRTTSLTATLANLDPILNPTSFLADTAALVDRGMQGYPFGGLNDSFDGPDDAFSTGTAITDFAKVYGALNPASMTIETDSTDANIQADTACVLTFVHATSACALAQAAAFVFQGEVESPTLLRGDIDQVTGQVRGALQLAINDARASLDREHGQALAAALAATAYATQETARAILQALPPVVVKASPVSGHLRLVAHALYGDESRAPQLQRLNSFGRNTFVNRGDQVVCYAA